MTISNPFVDQRVLYDSLLAGQDTAFEYLYRQLHHRMAGYVYAAGGSRNDTKTVVHESIITLLFNLRHGKYKWHDEAELLTYVVSIARHKWSEMNRQKVRQQPMDPGDLLTASDSMPTADEGDEPDFEQRRLAIERNVQLLGEKCRRCIDLFYFQRKSMREIATLLGWADERVARKEKYRCLAKLRQLLGLSNWTD